MSLTKVIVTQESSRTTADRMEFHLWKESTFLRAYNWSVWLACRYLPDFRLQTLDKGCTPTKQGSWSVHRQPVPLQKISAAIMLSEQLPQLRLWIKLFPNSNNIIQKK